MAYHRAHPKTNASIISMIQRFADISVVFSGLGFVVYLNQKNLDYQHIIIALIALAFSKWLVVSLIFIVHGAELNYLLNLSI